MTLGEKIKMYRNMKGLTQKQLGDITKIHEVTIRKYEADKITPKPEQLDRISMALGVPLNAFLDLSIFTDADVMPLLFAIDDAFGVNILSDDGKSFQLEFKEPMLNYMLQEWQGIQKLYEAGGISDEDYRLWKLRRPTYIKPIIGNE